MRHHNANRKFGRVRKVRNGLLKSLALSLITDGRMMTTEAKAKEIRPVVEKMVSLGLKNTLASRRIVVSQIGEAGAKKLIKDISPKYSDRKGGFTRITKLPQRLSDGAKMAVIEFV
jgi:large subunit ribosomal protein L17